MEKKKKKPYEILKPDCSWTVETRQPRMMCTQEPLCVNNLHREDWLKMRNALVTQYLQRWEASEHLLDTTLKTLVQGTKAHFKTYQ